ncbi:MAG TPA: hypothetical protein VFG18_09515 [Xanthomonadaceae bacterium]|jgi:hypothetical protein|nr:hypothetical protein [Xanthomonadaceae bacterium]
MAQDGANGKRPGNRWSLAIWGAAGILLLLPAIAMRFTSEVDWGPEDFIVMGAMLATACGAYELATRLSGSTAYRAGAAVAIMGGFLVVWVNLAVGMLGSENNPENLIFAGVLAIGVIGALAARFRAAGMVHALHATALAQAATVLYALVSGHAAVAPHIALFVLPWLLSAQLFRLAARGASPAAPR